MTKKEEKGMGFLSASVGFSRYKVSGKTPENFWSWALERLQAEAFTDKVAGVTEWTFGWASPLNPLEPPALTMNDIAFGEYLLVTLRVDQRKVAPNLLKRYCLIEEKRILAERDIERLPAKMKREIREHTRMQLLAKTIPVPNTYDLFWNISTGQVLFCSQQQKIQALAEDLFKKTFDTGLEPLIPYTLAIDLASSDEQKKRIKELKADVLI